MEDFAIGELWLLHRALQHYSCCPRFAGDAIESVAIMNLLHRLHNRLDVVALDHLSCRFQEEPDALVG